MRHGATLADADNVFAFGDRIRVIGGSHNIVVGKETEVHSGIGHLCIGTGTIRAQDIMGRYSIAVVGWGRFRSAALDPSCAIISQENDVVRARVAEMHRFLAEADRVTELEVEIFRAEGGAAYRRACRAHARVRRARIRLRAPLARIAGARIARAVAGIASGILGAAPRPAARRDEATLQLKPNDLRKPEFGEYTCYICTEFAACGVCAPCGHTACCKCIAVLMRAPDPKCGVCRVRIAGGMHMYPTGERMALPPS